MLAVDGGGDDDDDDDDESRKENATMLHTCHYAELDAGVKRSPQTRETFIVTRNFAIAINFPSKNG